MLLIKDFKSYVLSLKDGNKIYDFIKTINKDTKKGRYDFNENCYLNLVSYTTEDKFDNIFENHKDYIDVHYIIDGAEKIYYGDKESMKVTQKYDEKDDYELLKGDSYKSVEYTSGQAVELLPDDCHMAGYGIISPSSVLKIILKIKK